MNLLLKFYSAAMHLVLDMNDLSKPLIKNNG